MAGYGAPQQGPQGQQRPMPYSPHQGGFQMDPSFMSSVLSRLTGMPQERFANTHPSLLAGTLSRLTGVKHFAMGGIVNRPTLAMVGEAGPEAIVPLGRPGQARPGRSFMGRQRGSMGGMGGGQLQPGAMTGLGGFAGGMLERGADQGAFGPTYLRDMARRGILGNQNAMQRRGQVASRFAGLDPIAQRQAQVDASIQGNAGTANALNQAEMQGYQGYQDLLGGLLGQESSRGSQAWLNTQRGELDRWAQRDERDAQGGMGGYIGQLGGAALGGWLGRGKRE